MSSFNEAMQEVLVRPEYNVLTGRSIDYQQVIMEALGRAFLTLFERFQFNMPDPSGYNLRTITIVFIVVSALILFGVIMAAVYVLLRNRGRSKSQSVSEIFDDIAHKRFSLTELLRLSKEYAADKNFRDAVRHHYIAVLVALDDKKTIQVDKSKTNAQLAWELSQVSPALSGTFVSVVDVFQQTWFGKKDVNEDQYHYFAANVEEILHEK